MALSDANPDVDAFLSGVAEAREPGSRACFEAMRWQVTREREARSLQLDLDFLSLFELERDAQLLHLKEIVAGRKRHPADGGVYNSGLAAVAYCDVVLSDAGSGDLEHARTERRGLPRLELNIGPYQVAEG